MRAYSRGFTLIEILVGMAVGMIMLLATAGIFMSTKKAFVFQNAQSEVSQEGRFGVDLLRRLIGQAGYRAVPATISTNVLPAAAGTPPFTKAVQLDSTGNILILRFQSDGNQIDCTGATLAANANLSTDYTEIWIKYVAATTSAPITPGYLQCGSAVSTGAAITAINNYVDLIGTSNSSSNPAPLKVDGFTPTFGVDTSTNAANSSSVGCSYPGNSGTTNQGDCLAKSYVGASAMSLTPDRSTTWDWERVVAVRVCLKLETVNNVIPSNQTYSYVDCSGTLQTGQSGTTLVRTITATSRLHNLVNS